MLQYLWIVNVHKRLISWGMFMLSLKEAEKWCHLKEVAALQGQSAEGIGWAPA